MREEPQAAGRIFWPEKRVKQAFREARLEIKAGNELKALRIFYRRMEYFFRTSTDVNFSQSGNRDCFVIARYEKPILDRDIAELSGTGGKVMENHVIFDRLNDTKVQMDAVADLLWKADIDDAPLDKNTPWGLAMIFHRLSKEIGGLMEELDEIEEPEKEEAHESTETEARTD
jgi:hypothetical protein